MFLVRRLPCCWAAVALAIALLLVAGRAAAQSLASPAPSASAAAPAPEPADPDSPRASIGQYLQLARAGRFAEAAAYLDAPRGRNGAELAEQLRALLDAKLWVEPDDLSPRSSGDVRDGLPPFVDELGTIESRGQKLTVRIVRRPGKDHPIWVFSQGTLARVPALYATLGDHWLRTRLPAWAFLPGPKELLWWQWIALPLYAAAAWYLGRALAWLTLKLLRRMSRRTDTPLDDAFLARAGSPVAFGFALLVMAIALRSLTLYEPAEAFVWQVLRAGLFVAVFWLAFRAVDVVVDRTLDHESNRASAAARSLVPLGSRIAKIVLLVMGVIGVLSELGYPVASLIAGLGIGGIALALAAQKTVENLFGSLSIGIDRPFSVGDTIRVENLEGEVEAIGLRSTRVRTADRTVVTIPNGKLADLRIETFAPRDRFRFSTQLSVDGGTRAPALRALLDRVEAALRSQEKIWPHDLSVRLVGIGQSSLEIEVQAWFSADGADDFKRCREAALLAILDAVDVAGVQRAVPTRAVHVIGDPAQPAKNASAAASS